jgi:hypothetical protein
MQPIPEALVLGFPVGSVQRAKAEEFWSGIGTTYELAKKYKLKTAWGTDVLFSRALAQQQGAILTSDSRPVFVRSTCTGNRRVVSRVEYAQWG